MQEAGLFVYACLLVCVIPSYHVQACLLYAPGLLSLSFDGLSYFKLFILSFFWFKLARRWEEVLSNTHNCCGSFSLEDELSLKVQTGERLCLGVHESRWQEQ